MTKGVIKEIIIVLLLILAIILILGVLLYEYVPSNKQLPDEISYVTPQNVKEKLGSIEGVDEDQVILTYELNQNDLYNYQRVNQYKPGKSNPFSTYEKPAAQPENQNGSTGTGTNSGTNSGTSTSSNTGTNTNSGTSTSTNDNTYTAPTSQGGVNPGNYTNKSGTK